MTYDDMMDWLKDQSDMVEDKRKYDQELLSSWYDLAELVDELMSTVQEFAEEWYENEKWESGESYTPLKGKSMGKYRLTRISDEEETVDTDN